MQIDVRPASYAEVQPLRELYRAEAACQIVHDSALARGLADPFLIVVDGQVAGYGGVWNKYHKGQLMEFYVQPHWRTAALPLGRALIAASGATHLEAQTNMPFMLQLLMDGGKSIKVEAVLFADAFRTQMTCPHGVFRHATPADTAAMFTHHREPVGEWVIDGDDKIVATGGALYHYNPPYGDIFMEVLEPARRRGYGSYLVQEIKRVQYETGHRPAARCSPDNLASRLTLQKAGLLPCGHLLSARVAPGRPVAG